jgi:pyochelin synthetase
VSTSTSTSTSTSVSSLLAEMARAGVKLRLLDKGLLEVIAPRGALSEHLRSDIAHHKTELVAHLSGGQPDELPRIEPDEEHLYEPFAPTDLQQAFIIGSREGFQYHVRPHQYSELDFDELDPHRFGAALNEAVRRQRKNLVVVRDDLLLQTVRDPAPVPVTVCDLRQMPDDEARDRMRQTRATMEREEPPHDRWPWLAPRLSLYSGNRVRLHFNNNNLFADAPSAGRLIADALHCYHHPDQPLPELELSFRDCALALARLEESPMGKASQAYWCDRMADWPGAPDLPLVATGAQPNRSRLSRRELFLSAPQWTALKQQAEARGLTLTSMLLGAHADVIALWSGSRHFLLNNMISHRSLPLHPQMTELLGNFAALYPLEVDWRHDEPFTERLRRLQRQMLDDVAHTHWSGSKVLQTFNQVRRTPGQAVLPFAIGSALFVGPAQRPYYSMLETPQTLLDTEFWGLRDGRLWVTWDVIEAMFPAGLIDSMFGAYQRLLGELATGGQAWESRAHDLLPAADRNRRDRLNQTAPLPGGLLHSRLPDRARELGRKPAVVTTHGKLSYAALQRCSARIAELLAGMGCRPGDLVAIMTPKSTGQVAAVFGALTAGAAYVPLDPEWPDERVRHLLADTGASALLTTESQRGRLDQICQIPVLAVDGPRAGEPPGGVTDADRAPDDLAYVIYTSGSTGTPKGAMLSHEGPLNTITDINQRFGVGAGDVLLGVSSLCFDLSVYDIFGTVAAGATLVLPDLDAADPAGWLELMRRHRVSVWNSVPALMELLAEAAELAGSTLPALRTVLLSGDWIPVTLPERIRRIAPNARVVSLGGATEASIWSICYPIDRQDPGWASIPYGRPLAGQSWHVLDEQGCDVPTWVPGHLHIGGAGLALGYFADPERTAAAFVTHPATGERLYRTGDLGRYLPGGDIEFLGRADFQVKIQGYRVEPGEIEHHLLGHPEVGQAAVVARQSGSGKQLVAFAAGRGTGRRLDQAELRSFLSGRLPAYLVPHQIRVLDRLPLTGNGKLDRQRLQAPDGQEAGGEQDCTPPGTPTERTLAGIWKSVLSAEAVGVHDDFFELGGQSFAALRVSGLIAERLGCQVPLGVLLERRTIAQLADWIESAGMDWSPLVRLGEGRNGPAWFFVHPAGGNVVCYRDLAGLATGDFYAFQAPGPDGGQQPLMTVPEFARLYLDWLLRVQPDGPYRLGGWSSGAVIAAEMARQLEATGRPLERLLVIDAPAPVAPRAVDEGELLLWFLADLGLGPGSLDADAARELAGLPEAERLERCAALLGPQARPDAGLGPADLGHALAVFRGVVLACNGYRAGRIRADITVARAEQDGVAEFAGHPRAGAADWGWSALTSGSVDAHVLPGTHYTLLSHRGPVTALAAVLNSR